VLLKEFTLTSDGTFCVASNVAHRPAPNVKVKSGRTLTFNGQFTIFGDNFYIQQVYQEEKYGCRLCFHDSTSLLLLCLPPTSNNMKSTPSSWGMPASITTMITFIPIPMILTLTQQSMMLHNRKV
jgi:hypothetical protein